MIWVLIWATVIWVGGSYGGLSVARRWQLTALLGGVVLLSHLVLPEGAGIRVALGGNFTSWAVLFAVVALVALYGRGLAWLKARAPKVPVADAQEGPFSETELSRYARHVVLREIGGPGQVALKNARVLVVGAGGLGSPVLLYLAAAGVGTIGVIDDDTVDNSNLQRQVIHRDADIGMPKVFSAEAAMRAQNPAIIIRPYNRRLTADVAQDLMRDYDLVLEGTDNFETRYLVNRVAAALGIPMIGGALSQWEGQVSTFDPANDAPCYQCIFPEAPAPGLAPSCSEAGVVGPLPGIIGSIMATEAIKEIAGAGEGLRGRMLIYDAMYAETRVIRTARRHGCPCCG
ncbi:Molybdopterin or thiamine biosynthesis adenylyltransferase [Aliiroseovarius sediminilitoris]|uniref:Molybdopterin-synthase adenylyltransferase n=1 Tax=Aliiroseovarius sediminilitoris TaxID=1173584 RepID=A0A1I0QQ61_9RHOB|nr:molybdopterin-synthase adenylyltransferase MoeB [Aliiroseovarius sediminilitoris]SEW29590.1 Molybdopterin or thiamine biosynthesis adenylyltransferase [Aliiroseovarius sediminilitoris]